MKFDKNDITDINSLRNKTEARAYFLFLESEKRRHRKDVYYITVRQEMTAKRFPKLREEFNW